MVARKWPEYVTRWEDAEQKLMKLNMMPHDQEHRIKQQIKKIIFFIMLIAFSKRFKSRITFSPTLVFLVEHNLGIASGIYSSKSCWSMQPADEAYFRNSFIDFFTVFNIFAWNFIDAYLIIISVLLTENFTCINRKLNTNNTRIKSSQFWNDAWAAYKVSVNLVEETNDLNGGTILISFFSNLYFVCVQLLGCFKSESTFVDGLHLWLSLIFLIGRTLAVCWFASQINDESMKPLHILRSVQSDYFDITMKRFSEHLATYSVALSGMNFFQLTRKLILSISGTVVTYELVLVQFNEAEQEISDNNSCT
ncbi:CLUMA_CG012846, isoform A [Clunio marinus]|uniref:CLUMA_CG012846, isoform A n=1 Tax=Clunio marinus TaxID=568069 RepID=A0A1J1IGY7_9DIPT|nr:CLUMA_CG012846, isoform A [Clunio marinus]